jgi:catechol 2,3-dioxygenase-like lactoylglutathione lyase family enzyme
MTPMPAGLALIAVLVRDYDEAIAWYTRHCPFALTEDRPLGGGKRWVVLSAVSGEGTGLLLARAVGPEQECRVGDQAGGRVFLFLRVDDVKARFAEILGAGVVFEGPPRDEPYGLVAVFRDLYGNRWDLLGPAPQSESGRPA